MIMETTLALLSSIARTSRTNEFNPILSCNKGFPTVRWFDEIDCYLIEQLIASNNMQCLNPTWAYQYQIWKLINNKTYQLVGTLPSRCISVGPSRSGTTVLLQNICSIDIQIDCPKQQMFSPYIEVDSSRLHVKWQIKQIWGLFIQTKHIYLLMLVQRHVMK